MGWAAYELTIGHWLTRPIEMDKPVCPKCGGEEDG